MDKHYDSVCSYLHTQLGILIDTRSLALSIPGDKREEKDQNDFNNMAQRAEELHF